MIRAGIPFSTPVGVWGWGCSNFLEFTVVRCLLHSARSPLQGFGCWLLGTPSKTLVQRISTSLALARLPSYVSYRCPTHSSLLRVGTVEVLLLRVGPSLFHEITAAGRAAAPVLSSELGVKVPHIFPRRAVTRCIISFPIYIHTYIHRRHKTCPSPGISPLNTKP